MKKHPRLIFTGIFLASVVLLAGIIAVGQSALGQAFGEQGSLWTFDGDGDLTPIDSTWNTQVEDLIITGTCTGCPGGSGSGISTSSPVSSSNLLYYSAIGAGSAKGVATTTLSGNSQVAFTADPIVIGGSAITASIVADSIGDSQLAFNTGQNLTSASSPTFGGLTLSAALTIANGGTGTTTAYDTGVLFYNSSLGTYSQASRADSNHNLVWDRTTPGLGIGTTTPWGLLSINQNGQAGGVPSFVVGSSTATQLIVSNSGRVGVATSTPSPNHTFSITGTGYISSSLQVGTLSGVLIGTNGLISAGVDGTNYTLVDAVSCTNQVVTALTAAGVGTCSSINNAFWSGTDLSVANGGTGLSTFGGTNTVLYTTAADTLSSEAAFTYNPSTNLLTSDFASTSAVSIGASGVTLNNDGDGALVLTGTSAQNDENLIINLDDTANEAVVTSGTGVATTTFSSMSIASVNNWISGVVSAARMIVSGIGASFTPANSGEFGIDTTSNQWKYNSNSATRVLVPTYTMAFEYATSSAWTATTTRFMAPAPAAITFTQARCETNTGTLGVSLYDGTNRANYIPTASTTIGTNNYSSNNTFTANESIRVDVGNPASSPTKIACRFTYTYDAD